MGRRALLIAVVTAMLVVVLGSATESDADVADRILIDFGNGDSQWYDASSGTYLEVITAAVSSSGSVLSYGSGISVDGLEQRTIGEVVSSWRVFTWSDEGWSDSTGSLDMNSAYPGGPLAIGFYPEGLSPSEDPEHSSSWTMMRGDSSNTGSQTTILSKEKGSVSWVRTYGDSDYVNATILVSGGYAYIVSGGGYTPSMNDPCLHCYEIATGNEVWNYSYPKGAGYETATGLIAGESIFIPATNGTIYKIPLSGPGMGGSEVETLDVPLAKDHELIGNYYSTGAATMIYDSGVIYFGSSNGYLWCIDTDLNIVWKSELGGSVYYNAPTVIGDHVTIGALNGRLYLFDRYDGSLQDETEVFTITKTVKALDGTVSERKYGGANVAVLVDDLLMLSFTDGQGMNSIEGGIAGYRILDGKLVQVFFDKFGLTSNYLTPVDNGVFIGVYMMNSGSLCRMSTDGTFEIVVEDFGESFKAPLTLVNGKYLYIAEYNRGGRVFQTDLDGKVLGYVEQPSDVADWCMHPPVLVDGRLFMGTDNGSFVFDGAIFEGKEDPSPESSGSGMSWAPIIIAILAIAAVVAALSYIRRRNSGERIGVRSMSKVSRRKHRLFMVLVAGSVAALVLFLLTLSWGPSGTYGLSETVSNLFSGISKSISGEKLDYDEVIVFDSRCSRAVAAFAVGIGLSISGSIYQAIIRNPMVDPYIMGVSAGAGVAAIAVIAFDFTFFGLFDDVTYTTPIVAMIGGLAAFACTMLLAEKAGGSSLNYVLAGVIIGLVFSAIQTLMLSMAGNKLNSAMSWLFGSFANISWTQTILIFIPVLAMSLVPLLWAKEFNLVLLGDDQARQMGLDVRTFNRCMLILASVLASVCVAFVGIIGFVGLVVPHLCRMILGGDHRLVMPASMVLGGALMMAADLFAKMAWVPLELPVGAITTVIGAPVFAYLLIRKGRMYDG